LIGKCEICGAETNLQTHHISYDPEITIRVCVKCHNQLHPHHGVGKANWAKLTKEQLENFRRMWEEGERSVKKFMEAFGISAMTVYNYKKKLGLKGKLKYEGLEETKIIKVSLETYEWLREHGNVTNSFDSVIKKLIKFYEEKSKEAEE